MDNLLFNFINGLAGRWPLLDAVGVFFAAGLIWLMIVLTFALYFFGKLKKQNLKSKAVIAVFAAGVIGYAFNYLISLLYFRPRPFVALTDAVRLIEKSASEASFPSDHATLAFVIAAAVFLSNRKLGYVFLILAVLVALGRVFVGVHYVSDVLAGALLGAFWSFAVYKLYK